MKKTIFFFLVTCYITSCKAPLPIYFDKPVGTVCDSFPRELRGNYLFVNETEIKNALAGNGKYEIGNDSIFLAARLQASRDSMEKVMNQMLDTNKQEQSDSLKDMRVLQDEPVNDFIKLNDLAVMKVLEKMELKGKKDQFGFLKITASGIEFHTIDSNGINHVIPLLMLGHEVKVGQYANCYFLNLGSEYGWEPLLFETWKKEFLCINAFCFIDYNDKAKNEKEFMSSVKNYYKGLKPLYNNKGQLMGVKAKTDPKKVLFLFNDHSENMFLLRIK